MRHHRLLLNGAPTPMPVEACEHWWEKARGWIGMPATLRILKLEPCSAVHTFGMRHELDVLFTCADGRVLRCVRRLRPWRIAGCQGAAAAWEMPAGLCDRIGIDIGDLLDDEAPR